MRIGGDRQADLKEGKAEFHLSSESKKFSNIHLNHVSGQVSSLPQTIYPIKGFI